MNVHLADSTHKPPISSFTRAVTLVFPLSEFVGLGCGLVGAWQGAGVLSLNHMTSIPSDSVALKLRESAMESTESKDYVLCLGSSASVLIQAITVSLLQLPFTVVTEVSSFLPLAYLRCSFHSECPFLLLHSFLLILKDIH